MGIDALRGVALMGIFVVNLGSPTLGDFLAGGTSPANRAVQSIVFPLVYGKMYPIFAMLFGWGVALQYGRETQRRAPFLPLHLRRMAVLLGLGLLHGLLVWDGDILHIYALLGFVLLPFLRLRAGTLTAVAALCLAAPALTAHMSRPAAVATPLGPTVPREFVSAVDGTRTLYETGSYASLVVARGRLMLRQEAGLDPWRRRLDILGMMLLGVVAGRLGLPRSLPRHAVRLRRALPWLAALGLLGVGWSLIGRLAGPWWPLLNSPEASLLVKLYAAPALSLVYAIAVLLAAGTAAGAWLMRPLASAGRMSLTNYLVCSLAGTTLFYGYGAGLYGTPGPLAGVSLAIGLFALQTLLSGVWLARHPQGPAEWLWRKLAGAPATPALARAGLEMTDSKGETQCAHS